MLNGYVLIHKERLIGIMKATMRFLAIALIYIFSTGTLAYSSVKGTVVDTNDKPIAGAEVTALVYSEDGPTLKKMFTDQSGKFTYVSKIQKKSNYATFLVVADSYSWGYGIADLSKKDQSVKVSLYREQKINGKVVDEQGNPLPGVKVTIERTWEYDGNGRHLELNFDTTDWHISEMGTRRDGTFVLNHLPSAEDIPYGNVVIKAQMQGRAMVTKTIDQKDLPDEQTITLPRECALAGVIYLPNKSGTIPEGTPLILQKKDGDYASRRTTTVGKDGRFLISQLAPGNYELTSGVGYEFSWNCMRAKGEPLVITTPPQPDWVLPAVNADIGPDEAKIVDVVTTPGVIVKGKVLTFENEPVKDAVVTAEHAGNSSVAATDQNGDFTLRVAAGDVSLRVTSVFWNECPRTLQKDDGTELSFKVAEGEQKTDAILKVITIDPSDDECSYDDDRRTVDEMNKKPMIKDLALKAGSYDLKWDPAVEVYHSTSQRCESKKDEEVRKLMTNIPKLGSEKAKYLAFKFDSDDAKGLLLAILDESHGTGTGYDTVYFDRNRNTDLSDDEPVKLPRQGSFTYTYSKWADSVLYHVNQTDKTYLASVRLQYYRNPNYESIDLQRNGAWRGKIASNKGPIDCIYTPGYDLSDPFGKKTTRIDVYGSGIGDNIYIDTNGYGKAMAYYGGPHRIRLDVPARVAYRYYDIDVSKTADKITIKPYTGKLGKLTITSSGISGYNATPVKVRLYNDHGEYSFDFTKGPAELPAGTYKMSYCKFDLKNKAGESTSISCQVHDKLLIEANKTTNVDISGKITYDLAPGAQYLTLRSDAANGINARAKIGDKVTVAVIGKKPMTSIGCSYMMEFFESGYSADNLMYPQIELIDKNGKTIFSGVADDRDNNPWLCAPFAVKLPAIEPGTYEIRVIADTKTPLGKLTAQKQAIVRDPAYSDLSSDYWKSIKAGDTAKAENTKDEILEKFFTWKINPGKPYEVSYRNYGEYPTKDKLSAIVKWYVAKDYLRIIADVTDAFFATDPYQGADHRASSIRFYADPSGTGDGNIGITVFPKGKDGVPRFTSPQLKDLPGVKAKYQLTPKGYHIDLWIPWKLLKGYSPDWKLMPVGVMLNARTGRDRTQLQFTQGTDVFYNPRGFAALTAPSAGK